MDTDEDTDKDTDKGHGQGYGQGHTCTRTCTRTQTRTWNWNTFATYSYGAPVPIAPDGLLVVSPGIDPGFMSSSPDTK